MPSTSFNNMTQQTQRQNFVKNPSSHLRAQQTLMTFHIITGVHLCVLTGCSSSINAMYVIDMLPEAAGSSSLQGNASGVIEC